MDITIYKLLHILGVLLVFQGIGAAVALAKSAEDAPWRRATLIGHGIGLLLILVAGFGQLAKMGIMSAIPGWAWVKVVVWLLLGAAPFLIRRGDKMTRIVWGAALGLGTIAAYMAIFKPF